MPDLPRTHSCVRRTQDAFGRYGAGSLLFAKFVPGGLGGVIWAGAFVGLGWVFSSQIELAASYVAHLGSWVIVLLAVALNAYIAWKFIARQRFLRKIRIAGITPAELKTRLDASEDMMVVDLRHRVEAGHLEISRDREIVLYCT